MTTAAAYNDQVDVFRDIEYPMMTVLYNVIDARQGRKTKN